MATKKRGQRFSLFDPHHVIERQTVWIGTSLMLLIGGVAVSQIHYNHEKYVQLMTVDTAGASSNFSKTNAVTVTLGKTHLSPNRKLAYIPLTFNSTDQVGIRANNYKFYITSASGKAMNYKVTGSYIMYGTNGRGVLVLQSPTGILNQPLDLFILNLKKVPTAAQEQQADNAANNSGVNPNTFGKFDVAPFKINPGAVDVAKHKRFDIMPDRNGGIELYDQLFGSNDSAKINKVIQGDKKVIQTQKKIANGLRDRLKAEGYDVPDNPPYWKDDWRPADAINLKTGKTGTGQSAMTYAPDSNNSDTDQGFPKDLKNQDGTTLTENAQANSDSSSDGVSSASSSSSTSANSNSAADQIGGIPNDPAAQWNQLTTAWVTIQTAKRDIYVTQYQRLYKSEYKLKNVMKQMTIGKSSNVLQRGKVEVKN